MGTTFSSTALVDWTSGCREISVCTEEQPQCGQELSPACSAVPLGAGRQAVSSDTGSADAAPGQGMD